MKVLFILFFYFIESTQVHTEKSGMSRNAY